MTTFAERASLAKIPNGTGRLIESQLAAARWTNSPRPWWVMTIMREGRARDADLPPEARRAAQEQAEAAVRRLLALSPANPDGWLRLARLYLDRGERAGASRALELSFATGWSGKDVLLRRSRFALQNWNRLAPYTRRRLVHDFAGAIVRAPREFVQIAVKTGQVDVVRDALAGIPSLRRQFDALARRFLCCLTRKDLNWVSPSPKYVEARAVDRVIWGRRDSDCL